MRIREAYQRVSIEVVMLSESGKKQSLLDTLLLRETSIIPCGSM